MKRSPLKRSVKPMSKRSKNRGGVEAKDARWRREVLQLRGLNCGLCRTWQQAVHHIFGKNSHPRLRHEPLNGFPICNFHHHWIHENPFDGLTEVLYAIGPTDAAKLQQLASARR